MSPRVVRWAVVALVAVGGLVLLTQGADSPADPTLAPAPPGSQVTLNRVPFGDFGEIAFRIEGGAGVRAEARAAAVRCALLADTDARRGRGLMERRDLSGYDAMVFRFDADTTGGFYMKDTPLPLSIAFYDSAGNYVSGTDMAPCIHRDPCPTYWAEAPYRYAIEVPQGATDRLGIGPGTRLVLTGPCP